MTAWGSVDVAVEAMRRGARDFIAEAVGQRAAAAIVRTQVELARALRRGQRLEAENRRCAGDGAPPLIAESPAMQPVLQIDRARRPVRRQRADHRRERHRQGPGRAGAARRVAARARGRSSRSTPAGSSEGVFESELFGHVQGRVHRRQGRPRRPLRAGRRRHAVPRRDRQRAARASRRSCCACSRPASSSASARRARGSADVRAHLGDQRRPARRGRGGPLPPGPAVPPQHHRDPPAAAARAARGHPARWPRTSCAQHARRYRKPITGFDPAALQALLDHAWPGNVRELDHAVERAVLMAQGNVDPARPTSACARRRATARRASRT